MESGADFQLRLPSRGAALWAAPAAHPNGKNTTILPRAQQHEGENGVRNPSQRPGAREQTESKGKPTGKRTRIITAMNSRRRDLPRGSTASQDWEELVHSCPAADVAMGMFLFNVSKAWFSPHGSFDRELGVTTGTCVPQAESDGCSVTHASDRAPAAPGTSFLKPEHQSG